MKFIQSFLLLSFLFALSLWSATPVPYSGKIDIRGVNYFGEAQFAFSLHDENGTTHWRNGKQPGETIKVMIRNGRYSVLLGGQGMNSLPPELFLNHDKLYLKVEFDNEDGEGLRHLAPDQLITATPRALVADIAKVAEVAKVAKVAEKVGDGAITRDMLSSEVLSQLDANGSSSTIGSITRDMLPTSVLNDLNKTIVITRDMLPQDVRNDLNKSIVITRDMLPASVLNDLNKSVIITRDMLPKDVRDDLNKTVTITRNMLPADVLADLNKSSTTASPITLSMLAPEVTAKLDQNESGGNTTVVNPTIVGSTLAVPHGSSAPTGYSMYHQVGQPKELVWEEKAPVSVARYAYDGVEVLDGKIYFVGGKDGSSAKNIAERYDPITNTWETLNSMSVARAGLASAVLNGKLYVIGGEGLSSVEFFDPLDGKWTAGVDLSSVVYNGTAITINNKIYLVGGVNSSNQNISQVISFDPSASQWTSKANMPTARHGMKLVWFENRAWAIGGNNGIPANKVESYDPATDTWQTETLLTAAMQWSVAWVANERIYVGGGFSGTSYLNSTEVYDPVTKNWLATGNFPEIKYAADAVVLNEKAYVIAGKRDANNYSNKVFAADLNASVAGVYDLYRKDGNASAGTPLVQAEVADGSVTASKIASNTITTSQLNEQILKYLKPEITAQPQPKAVYADSNVSFSVTAEGKYLTYQWKKDGVNLVGETNATINITDANATNHDGNYTVVVSNDFGSVESRQIETLVSLLWSPSEKSNLTLWLDGSDSSTLFSDTEMKTATTGNVAVWVDKSGSNFNFTQSSAAKQPSYDSTNDKVVFYNQSLSATAPSIGQPITCFLVIEYSENDTNNQYVHDTTNSRFIFGESASDGFGIYASDPWLKSGSLSPINKSLFSYLYNGDTSYVLINGVQQLSGSVGTVGFSGNFVLGARHSEDIQFFKGSVYEFLIFSENLFDDSRQKVEGYLAHKWGLTTNLTADHPYKDTAP